MAKQSKAKQKFQVLWLVVKQILQIKITKIKAGFTLVELSIVLVIIGLIIGGVLVGKDLIHSAELRSLVSQYGEYEIAYNTFKTKYNCIPGDCADSVALFGQSPDGWSPSPHGNGMIEGYEIRYVCQQLTIAGLVKTGCITGHPWSPALGVYPNFNALPSVYSSTMLIDIFYNYPYIWSAPNIKAGNFLGIGGQSGDGSYGPISAVFNPTGMLPIDAKEFDTKIDDGLPYSGKLTQVSSSWYCGTYATNTYYPINYKDAAGTWGCVSMWKLD